MPRSRFPHLSSLATAAMVSFSLLLLLWFTPLLSSAQPQAQVFEQVWQTVNDNFFDPQFNGVDWKAMQRKYKSQAQRAKSSQEFAVVVNQMLSELQTSHTRFYTADEPAYYQILGIFQGRNPDFQRQLKKFFPTGKIAYRGIGIFTKDINSKTFISAILDDTPAAKAGLKVGDRIISANGKPFEPIRSFAGTGQTSLAIQRSPNSPQQAITVTPQMLDATTMFLKAQQASTQVIERAGKKIGYVHIWSYAGDRYQQQLEEDLISGRLQDADGLVLDLREGWGGAYPNYLNIYTARSPSVTMIARDRKPDKSDFHWNKPVVMLVNEGSRSGKEILAFGFQRYKIGPVVGSKTAGAVVGGRPYIMQDGSLLYLAVADVYVDDKYRLEGKGVTPDVSVPFSLEYAAGADPQKERAIEVALEKVKALTE